LDSYSSYWNGTSSAAYVRRDWIQTSVTFKKLITGKDMYGNTVDAGSIISGALYDTGSQSDYYGYMSGFDGGDTTENYVAGIDNPYASDYNYSDKSFFGRLSESALEEIFDEILDTVQKENDYDFLLEEGTNVTMQDPLGEGMEVKGEPVLRIFGENYAPTDKKTYNSYTIYTWNKKVKRTENSDSKSEDNEIDLSGIQVKVETESSGMQIVTFIIPEDALPTFYPDLNRNFYYEELPIRLIYRVGLSDAEKEKLEEDMLTYGEVDISYYTNRFDDGEWDNGATVEFTPAESNPYYTNFDNLSDSSYTEKEINATESLECSFEEGVEDGTVYQYLGNNGLLSIEYNGLACKSVQKKWAANVTTHPDSVNVNLYVKGVKTNLTDSKDTEEFVKLYDTVTLSNTNNWKYTWADLPKADNDGDYLYQYNAYYIAEESVEGFAPTYTNGLGYNLNVQELTLTGSSNNQLTGAGNEVDQTKVVDIEGNNNYNTVNAVNADDVIITNNTSYKLPNSGGVGDTMFTLGATALIGAALFMYIIKKRNNERI
jgi:LPXTG-motif cell wall-anchored protein